MAAQHGADLSELVAIVPVGRLEGAKSRLGDTLDAEERMALVIGLLDRTLDAVRDVAEVGGVTVVTPDPAVLAIAGRAGVRSIPQPGEGLNDGLRTAASAAVADGATALLILALDLPAISPGAIRALLEEAAAVLEPARPLVAIVADRHGRGTNALLVSPPDIIPFAYGPGSLATHIAAARAAGAVLAEVGGPLSLDLDLPEDLIRADELGLLDPARVG